KGLDNYAGREAGLTWRRWGQPEEESAGLDAFNTRFYSAHLRHYDAQGRLISETDTVSARGGWDTSQRYLLDTTAHPDFVRNTTYQYDILKGRRDTTLAIPSAPGTTKARATLRETDALGRVIKEQGE